MKKFTFLLITLFATTFAVQVNAGVKKAPMRSAIWSYLPSGFAQLPGTSIYYNVSQRYAAGANYQTGYSILGLIDGQYYSSTYEAGGEGAGFIAAFQVNGEAAAYLNASTGTTSYGVTCTSRIEPQGDVAAKITYTLTNNNNAAVTINAGVWADIMIGNNDRAPLECMRNTAGATYGIKMKHNNTQENPPLLCALFGENITGVTAADEFWFGYFGNNYAANAIVGNYDNVMDFSINAGDIDGNYMKENGDYDCGLGFSWKNREISAGESIELSYLISVGEIDFEEPVIPDPDPEPGEDRFTYHVEAFDTIQWNTYSADHRARVYGEYEHPYGQDGFLEYRVDGGEWMMLDTLKSGFDYDMSFFMNFDESITDIHTLEVRFSLGLGTYVDMAGLSWTDVRSFNVSGIENRVYNGAPQEFQVGIDREVITYIGETYPGEYNFKIEGSFDDGTIGVKNVPYIIDRAPCVYDLTHPESREKYEEGKSYGATVTVPEGSGVATITYLNLTDPNAVPTTTAPSAPGRYAIYLYIDDSGAWYYGTEGDEAVIVWTFEIYETTSGVEELTIENKDNGVWYTIDGRRVAAPSARGIYIHNGKKYIVK